MFFLSNVLNSFIDSENTCIIHGNAIEELSRMRCLNDFLLVAMEITLASL